MKKKLLGIITSIAAVLCLTSCETQYSAVSAEQKAQYTPIFSSLENPFHEEAFSVSVTVKGQLIALGMITFGVEGTFSAAKQSGAITAELNAKIGDSVLKGSIKNNIAKFEGFKFEVAGQEIINTGSEESTLQGNEFDEFFAIESFNVFDLLAVSPTDYTAIARQTENQNSEVLVQLSVEDFINKYEDDPEDAAEAIAQTNQFLQEAYVGPTLDSNNHLCGFGLKIKASYVVSFVAELSIEFSQQ